MPKIGRFVGIVIGMYYNDHAPPHFHAAYGAFRCKIDLATSEVIAGHLPRRALTLMTEWCRLRKRGKALIGEPRGCAYEALLTPP